MGGLSTVSTVGDVNGRVGQALIHNLRGVDIANATYNWRADGGDWDDESRNADISDQNIYVKVVFGANDGMLYCCCTPNRNRC